MEEICVFIIGQEKLWSLSGLVLDFLGVILLGIDLIRVQVSQRFLAQKNKNEFEVLASNYGGIASWADDLRKGSRWVSSHEYSRYSIDDELTFNTNAAINDISDLANCMNGLGEQTANIVEIMGSNAENELRAAKRSAILSLFGLTLIAVGFFLQIVATLPCL